MTRLRVATALFLGVAVVVVTACQSARPSEGPTASATADAAAPLRVELPDGSALDAPVGAFPANTSVMLTSPVSGEPPPVPGATVLGRPLKIEAATQPEKPVLVTLPVPKDRRPDTSLLVSWTKDQRWELLPYAIGTDGKARAVVTHFSSVGFLGFPSQEALGAAVIGSARDLLFTLLGRQHNCSQDLGSRRLTLATGLQGVLLAASTRDEGTNRVVLRLCNTRNSPLGVRVFGAPGQDAAELAPHKNADFTLSDVAGPVTVQAEFSSKTYLYALGIVALALAPGRSSAVAAGTDLGETLQYLSQGHPALLACAQGVAGAGLKLTVGAELQDALVKALVGCVSKPEVAAEIADVAMQFVRQKGGDFLQQALAGAMVETIGALVSSVLKIAKIVELVGIIVDDIVFVYQRTLGGEGLYTLVFHPVLARPSPSPSPSPSPTAIAQPTQTEPPTLTWMGFSCKGAGCRIPVATAVVGAEPLAIAVNAATNRVYAVSRTRRNLLVFDGATGALVAEVPLPTPERPARVTIAVNPATNRIYVATMITTDSAPNQLYVVDGATHQVLAALTHVLYATGIAVDPTANRLYVSDGTEGLNRVAVIDGRTHALIASIAVGERPHDIAFNPVTRRAYVVNLVSDTVSVIDANSNSVVATIKVKADAIAVNEATNRIFLALRAENTITTIDGTRNAVTATVTSEQIRGPTGVGVDARRNRVYLANIDSPYVLVFDGSELERGSNRALGLLLTDNWAGDVAVNPQTSRVFALSWSSGKLMLIDDR